MNLALIAMNLLVLAAQPEVPSTPKAEAPPSNPKVVLVPALDKPAAQKAPEAEAFEAIPSPTCEAKKVAARTKAPPPQFTPAEQEALRLAKSWQEARRAAPARGENGAVTFVYGAEMPSVICAPLFICDVTLQRGEQVTDLNIGDAIRWKVAPAISGKDAEQVTHIIIKPTEPGLRTNLLVTTDRRFYDLQLVSTAKEWMPRISFAYPDDVLARWAAYQAQVRREEKKNTLPDGHKIVDLDFDYVLSGDQPRWLPLRVYSDGVKTYVQFPDTMKHEESPILVALGPGGAEQIVNYRIAGDRYVVDKVLTHAALLSGVGAHQERVEISRRSATPPVQIPEG